MASWSARRSTQTRRRCWRKLPVLTSWAFNVLGDHRNEITGYKLSKVEDVRLDRWTSVHYVKQVVGCAGTEGALTILHCGKKCRLVPTDDVISFFDEEEGASKSHMPAPGALGRIAVYGERETGTCMITMQYGDKDDTCMVGQAEYPAQGNCKAPIMASNVHEEDVSSHKLGSPCSCTGA